MAYVTPVSHRAWFKEDEERVKEWQEQQERLLEALPEELHSEFDSFIGNMQSTAKDEHEWDMGDCL